jgi:hypothetical protein
MWMIVHRSKVVPSTSKSYKLVPHVRHSPHQKQQMFVIRQMPSSGMNELETNIGVCKIPNVSHLMLINCSE